MTDELKKIYNESHDLFGNECPQEFNGVKFYPITLKYTHIYAHLISLLGIAKDTVVQSKEIIKMSYLKFIIYCVDESCEEQLVKILRHVCKTDNVYVGHRQKSQVAESFRDFDVCVVINDTLFTESDFDIIRELLLEQNGVTLDYINEYNPSLENALHSHRKMVNPATFEERLDSYCVYMRIQPTSSDIESLTIRKFERLFKRMVSKSEYEIYQPLIASGQIELKNSKLEHWLSHMPENGRYSEILIEKSKFESETEYLSGFQK